VNKKDKIITILMIYLPEKDWSSRYGTDFFTLSLSSRSVYETAPSNVHDPNVRHQNHPAVYFHVIVKSAHHEKLCPRRFSQFRHLYDELRKSPPPPQSIHQTPGYSATKQACIQTLHFPPKTCFFTNIDDELLDTRQEELCSFLEELLKIPNSSEHPAVRDFLELDGFGTQSQ
jgi:hypothetical protein